MAQLDITETLDSLCTSVAIDTSDALESSGTSKAPALPSFIDLAPTTIETDMTLHNIYTWLHPAFNSLSVDFKKSDQQYCGLTCTMFVLSLVEFEVSFFEDNKKRMIEFKRMCGSRESFVEAMSLISAHLKVSFKGVNRSLSVPPLPLDLPDLETTDKKYHVFDHLGAYVSDESMLSEKIQGLSGIVANFKRFAPEDMHEKIVNDMTFRIFDLIRNEQDDFFSLNMLTMCIFCIAILAEKLDTTLTPLWFEKAVPVVVAHIKNENLHVRREALRAALNLILKGKHFIDKIVNSEFIVIINLEAQGRDGVLCQDYEAMELAKKIIKAI